jgi:hypothetical protein
MDFHEICYEYHDIESFSTIILPNFIPSKCHGTYKVKATVAPFSVWPWNVKQCCNFDDYVIAVNMIIYVTWKMLNFYVQLSVLNTEVTHMKSDIEVYHKHTYKLCMSMYHFSLYMLKFEMMSENLEVVGIYIYKIMHRNT